MTFQDDSENLFSLTSTVLCFSTVLSVRLSCLSGHGCRCPECGGGLAQWGQKNSPLRVLSLSRWLQSPGTLPRLPAFILSSRRECLESVIPCQIYSYLQAAGGGGLKWLHHFRNLGGLCWKTRFLRFSSKLVWGHFVIRNIVFNNVKFAILVFSEKEGEHSIPNSCFTWRNTNLRCDYASEIPTGITVFSKNKYIQRLI